MLKGRHKSVVGSSKKMLGNAANDSNNNSTTIKRRIKEQDIENEPLDVHI